MIVLSHYQAAPLLQARENGLTSLSHTPDLGLTKVEVFLNDRGVEYPNGQILAWSDIERIAIAENKCFIVEVDSIFEIKSFSEYTGRVYSLYPTASGAPTMLVSGLPMHRIKGTDPYQDTLQKIKAIRPLLGKVLDTTMGLGYTAIQAARTAKQVITIELDEAAVEIARQNPWSQDLFSNPIIERHIGDSYDLVQEFADESFSSILHDPPVMSLAGELYSESFYRDLYRILKDGGRLFHYIGDPKSKSGRSTTRGVTRRLLASGFRKVVPRPNAFGVAAFK